SGLEIGLERGVLEPKLRVLLLGFAKGVDFFLQARERLAINLAVCVAHFGEETGLVARGMEQETELVENFRKQRNGHQERQYGTHAACDPEPIFPSFRAVIAF